MAFFHGVDGGYFMDFRLRFGIQGSAAGRAGGLYYLYIIEAFLAAHFASERTEEAEIRMIPYYRTYTIIYTLSHLFKFEKFFTGLVLKTQPGFSGPLRPFHACRSRSQPKQKVLPQCVCVFV